MAETCQEIFHKEAAKSACYIFCLLTCVIPLYVGLLWSEVRTLMETNHFPMRIKTPKYNSFTSTDHKFGLLWFSRTQPSWISYWAVCQLEELSPPHKWIFTFIFLILVKSGVPEFNLKQYLSHATGTSGAAPSQFPFPPCTSTYLLRVLLFFLLFLTLITWPPYNFLSFHTAIPPFPKHLLARAHIHWHPPPSQQRVLLLCTCSTSPKQS